MGSYQREKVLERCAAKRIWMSLLIAPSCLRLHWAKAHMLARRAISAAEKAVPAMAAMGSYQRKEVLEHCVKEFEARFEELAVSLCIEAGKPIKACPRSCQPWLKSQPAVCPPCKAN